MKRREFLATTLGATALAALPDRANAQEASDGWNAGQIHHLLPTANHNRVLIKVSFMAPLSRAPKLRMGSTLATTIQTDTQGQFWAFDIDDLESEVVGKDILINVSMVIIVRVGGGGHEGGRSRGKSSYGKFMQANFGIKPFVGSLDEVSIWARALTAAEVAEMAK